jgi:hypothetical protein
MMYVVRNGSIASVRLGASKSGRYRYYTCSTKARQSETGCKGRTVASRRFREGSSFLTPDVDQVGSALNKAKPTDLGRTDRGIRIIATRRSNIAHLRRPWYATLRQGTME